MSVSRDASDSRTRVCGNCRAKVAAERLRCPRCGATEAAANTEIDAASSRKLALIAGTLLALAVVALGAIYLQQPAETATVIPKSVADPLAARRTASAAAVAAEAEASAPTRTCSKAIATPSSDALKMPTRGQASPRYSCGSSERKKPCRISRGRLRSTRSAPHIT
jgi:hypothetical protein